LKGHFTILDNSMDLSEKALGLYHCTRVAISPETSMAAIQLAEKDCEEEGLDMAEINVIAADHIFGTRPEIAQALAACEAQLGLPAKDAQLVYCEWTWVHADTPYKKDIFVSVVLATGPEPYCIQALHSPRQRGDDVIDTKRIVSVGDVFVLDPCVAHMAAPTVPRTGAMLVLAQWLVRAETAAERLTVQQRFAPDPHDRHQSSLLDF
jgi:hypothetical protein